MSAPLGCAGEKPGELASYEEKMESVSHCFAPSFAVRDIVRVAVCLRPGDEPPMPDRPFLAKTNLRRARR